MFATINEKDEFTLLAWKVAAQKYCQSIATHSQPQTVYVASHSNNTAFHVSETNDFILSLLLCNTFIY